MAGRGRGKDGQAAGGSRQMQDGGEWWQYRKVVWLIGRTSCSKIRFEETRLLPFFPLKPPRLCRSRLPSPVFPFSLSDIRAVVMTAAADTWATFTHPWTAIVPGVPSASKKTLTGPEKIKSGSPAL
jgi:hypothetical protein